MAHEWTMQVWTVGLRECGIDGIWKKALEGRPQRRSDVFDAPVRKIVLITRARNFCPFIIGNP